MRASEFVIEDDAFMGKGGETWEITWSGSSGRAAGGQKRNHTMPGVEKGSSESDVKKIWQSKNKGKKFISAKLVKENIDVQHEITLEDSQDFHEEFGYLGYSVDENDLFEAEYQGRKVKLNKPMRGDVKKFKVYVKNKKGNVIKVNFGHGGTSAKRPTMRIRKSNPKARKSFRARHNCDNPGPKTKARYWSCRKW